MGSRLESGRARLETPLAVRLAARPLPDGIYEQSPIDAQIVHRGSYCGLLGSWPEVK